MVVGATVPQVRQSFIIRLEYKNSLQDSNDGGEVIIVDTFSVLIGMILPLILGWSIVKIILAKKNFLAFLEKFALSYMIGIGLLSLLMFILSLLHIAFTFFNITLSLMISILLCLLFEVKKSGLPVHFSQKRGEPLKFFDKTLISAIIFVFIYVFFRSIITPLEAFDSWAIYGFKAKVFYLAQTVPTSFFMDFTKSYTHFDYPLSLPLIESWIYICLGSWNDQLVKIIFPFFFLSLIIIFYCNLKKFTGRKIALLATLLLVTIPYFINFVKTGYADLPFAVYYLISVVYLIRGLREGDKYLLYISSISCGLAAWTKNEGLVISLSNTAIFFGLLLIQRKLNRRNLLLFLQYIFIIFLIISPWFCFKSFLHLSNDIINRNTLTIANIFDNLNRLPAILDCIGENMFVFKSLFLFKSWNLIWPLSAIILFFNFKKMFKFPFWPVAISLFLYMGIWILMYIITPRDINWHLATSADRLLVGITPLVLFLDVLLIFREPEV